MQFPSFNTREDKHVLHTSEDIQVAQEKWQTMGVEGDGEGE